MYLLAYRLGNMLSASKKAAKAALLVERIADKVIISNCLRLSESIWLLYADISAHIFDQTVIFRLCRSEFFIIDKRRGELKFQSGEARLLFDERPPFYIHLLAKRTEKI